MMAVTIIPVSWATFLGIPDYLSVTGKA